MVPSSWGLCIWRMGMGSQPGVYAIRIALSNGIMIGISVPGPSAPAPGGGAGIAPVKRRGTSRAPPAPDPGTYHAGSGRAGVERGESPIRIPDLSQPAGRGPVLGVNGAVLAEQGDGMVAGAGLAARTP